VLIDKVGSLRLQPHYAYTCFSCWSDVVGLLNHDFGGTAVDPTTALGTRATPTSATPITATIRALSHSATGTILCHSSDVFLTLPDLPASSNTDRLKLPSLELPGYDHGMLVTAHLHYTPVCSSILPSSMPSAAHRLHSSTTSTSSSLMRPPQQTYTATSSMSATSCRPTLPPV